MNLLTNVVNKFIAKYKRCNVYEYFLMGTFIDLPVKISKYQKVDDKFYYVGKKDGV